MLDIWQWSEICAQTYNFENFPSQGLVNILSTEQKDMFQVKIT